MSDQQRGAGGTPGGIGEPFNTLVMLGLLAGGIGLVARSLRSQDAPRRGETAGK